MPVTYELATPDTVALLHMVREKHHEKRGLDAVRFGVLLAHGPVDKYGIKSGPAIKGHAGAPAAAKVKSVPLKDRVTKEYDVEMILDGDEWPKLTESQQIAILDHELTHICLGNGTDDLPKIKMREEDFIAWGFWEVIKRHGAAAMEHRALKRLEDQHGQLFLELPDLLKQEPLPMEGTVTISANGEEVGKMTASEFSRIGEEVSQHLSRKRRSKKA